MTTWTDRDQAFVVITQELREIIRADLQKDVITQSNTIKDLQKDVITLPDIIKPKILSILREYKSIPLLELKSLSGFSIQELQESVQQLEAEDFAMISNPGNILEEVITAKRKALLGSE